VLPLLDGSARVSAGDVEITVGIRAELETIVDLQTYYDDTPKPLRIDFNVEFAPNTDSRFLGKEPMDVAELVRTALQSAYANEEALPSLKE
jgi:exosome complex RNA-binding protein Rrp42 (RNase PH superfamily)